MTPTRSLDELLYHMKTLARRPGTAWETNFARSMLRSAKRVSWAPSPKQLQIMQRMVSEMYCYDATDLNETVDLIDEEDRHHAA